MTTQAEIWASATQEPVTAAEIAAKIGISLTKASNYAGKLVSRGILARVGKVGKYYAYKAIGERPGDGRVNSCLRMIAANKSRPYRPRLPRPQWKTTEGLEHYWGVGLNLHFVEMGVRVHKSML